MKWTKHTLEARQRERGTKTKRNIQKLLICILMDRAAEDHMNEMSGISSLFMVPADLYIAASAILRLSRLLSLVHSRIQIWMCVHCVYRII